MKRQKTSSAINVLLEESVREALRISLTELLAVSHNCVLFDRLTLAQEISKRECVENILAKVSEDTGLVSDAPVVFDRCIRMLEQAYFAFRLFSVDGIATDPQFAVGLAELHLHALAGAAAEHLEAYVIALVAEFTVAVSNFFREVGNEKTPSDATAVEY